MLRATFFAIMLLLSSAVQAQMSTSSTTGETSEATKSASEVLRSGDTELTESMVRDLVARLSDEEVRALLLERLDQTAKAEKAAADGQGSDQGAHVIVQQIRDRIILFGHAVPKVPSELSAAFDTFLDGRPILLLWLVPAGFALMVVVGAAAEWIFKHLTKNARAKILNSQPQRPIAKLLFPAARLIINLAGLLVFLIGMIATFFIMYQGHEITRATIMTYVGVIGVARAIGMIFLFVLAPKAANLRLVSFSDTDAKFLYHRALFAVWWGSIALSTTDLLALLGIDSDVRTFLIMLIGIVLVATIVTTLIQARECISNDIRGPGDNVGPLRNAIAFAWPFLTSVLGVVMYLSVVAANLAKLQIPSGSGLITIIILITLPHLDAAIERSARFRMEEKERSQEFQVVIFRALRILVIVGAIFIITRVWGFDIGEVARDNVGGWLAGSLLDIGVTALITYILWQVVRIWVDRKLAAELGGSGEDGAAGDEGGQGGTRLSTLLPLIRTTLQITIGVIAVLVVLSGMGVDIGPLMAGAGVIGLAVGFGAQTLVKDIVSGAFFLVDDAFRVGEYIDVGSVKGVVEKISIRSFRLRHHRGLLHTIPFGEISQLTNFSRDWVIMKLEFRVAYDTDVNKVKKLFKKIGAAMLEHETLGGDFLEPFKSQGVKRMEDSAMILGAKYKTKPGQQFMIRKELYNRVQKAFAENDIHFAHRRVAVDLPQGIDVNTPQGKAITDAATAAAIASEQDKSPKPA